MHPFAKILWPLLASTVSGCLMSGDFAALGADSRAPASPSVGRPMSLGVYVGAVDLARVTEYESYLNRPMDYINDTVPSEDWDHLSNNSLRYYFLENWSRADGPKRLVITIPMLPTYGVYNGPSLNDADAARALTDGATGANDAYFVQMRRHLIATGYTTNFIRLGWEMNGNWYNWRAHVAPAAWVTYWRRIARILNDDPAAHFRFVWNPTLADQAIAAERVYPGDDLVDVIGIDVYDSDYAHYPATGDLLTTQKLVWDQTILNGPHGLAFYAAFAKSHGKPIHVDEWGVGPAAQHMGGDNSFFVQSLYDWAHDPANNVTLMMSYDDPTLRPGSTIYPNASARLKGLLGK